MYEALNRATICDMIIEMSIDILNTQATVVATETSDEVIFLPERPGESEASLSPSAVMGSSIVMRCLDGCPIRRLTQQLPSQKMCAAEVLGELPDTTTSQVMQGFDMLADNCRRGLEAGRALPIHGMTNEKK